MILTGQKRDYDCFDSKMASQKGFCGALPAFRHLVRKCALVHISVREAAGREGLILTDQNRDCHWFGSKMASQNGFCGVLPALHHLSGKRAVVHSSVREAAKRKGLMLSDVNLDYESFDGKMAAPK